MLDAGDTDITEYAWDHRNRLVKVTDYATFGGLSTQVVDHVYDAENQWIGQTIDHDGDSGTAAIDQVFRVYDGGQVVFKFEKSGAGLVTKEDLAERYLWGPAVDQLLAVEQVHDLFDAAANDLLWAATDHLGTVRDLLAYDSMTSTTELVAHIAYDTFGNILSVTDAVGAPLSASPIDIAWTGKIFEAYTGLQNNWHRWYDSAVGKWISEDPIKDGVNWSAYVANSVTQYVDPDGLEKHLAPKDDGVRGIWYGTPEDGWYRAHGEDIVRWKDRVPDFSRTEGAIFSSNGVVADFQIDLDDSKIDCNNTKEFKAEKSRLRRLHESRANAKMAELLGESFDHTQLPYTWHHVDGNGRVQLVRTPLHIANNPHTGGFNAHLQKLIRLGKIRVGGQLPRIGAGGAITVGTVVIGFMYGGEDYDPLGELLIGGGVADAHELKIYRHANCPSEDWFEYERLRQLADYKNARLLFENKEMYPTEEYIKLHPSYIEPLRYFDPWYGGRPDDLNPYLKDYLQRQGYSAD